jgi:hypothetical protein
MAEAATSVDDLNIWGGSYKNGAFHFDLVLNCRNKEENSLFQILELLPDMSAANTQVVAKR